MLDKLKKIAVSVKDVVVKGLAVATQPTGLKVTLAVLGALGVNPEVALAISELLPLAQDTVQSVSALVAGAVVAREVARNEKKKK